MSAEDEIPKYNELLWPTIVALRALGGSGTVSEIQEQVVADLGLSEEAQSVVGSPKQGPLLAYRLRWARTYLGKAEYLANSSRGVWSLTDAGKAAEAPEMDSVPARVRTMYAKGAKSSKPAAVTADYDESLPADAEDGVAWQDQVLDVVRGMAPDAFERLTQRLLRESGFVSVKVTGRTGDGGIDGIGVLQMNLISFPVFFQCKRYAGSVPSRDVRDFRGAMAGRGDKGVFVTTGRFTSGALQEANREGAPPIDLIDADRLCELLRDLRLGVDVKLVEKVSVDRDWFTGV